MKFRYSILAAVFISFLVLINCGDKTSGVDSDPPQASSLSVEYTGSKGIGRANHTIEPINLRNDATGSTASVNVTTTGKGCQVTASWTQCSSDDFASYTLYRSANQFISSDTTSATRLTTVSSVSSTDYTDNTVINATTYYYALKTTDESGLAAWSNEESITTSPGSPPEGMEFVAIPQGSFQMGAPSDEQGTITGERPVHTVSFNYDFEMMTTEVTQGMWLEVMGTNPSHFTGDLNRPVEYVSWDDCQEFVDAMNALDPSNTYRLPSESEWEYCCRAGTTERFYWGEDLGETEINGYAWWIANSDSTTHSVAGKLPNAWGLYDMSGNVFELCEDWYHASYNGAPSDGSPWLDTTPFEYRVVRGGSWLSDAARSASRGYRSPGTSSYRGGFRLARS